MALLQIAEPGQSSAPHEHKRAVGIDLGTTNTLVGAVRSGVPVTLKDALEQALIPSIVHYGEQVIVGTDAKPFAESDSANTIISVKRMMGRALKDVQSADPHLPYQLESTENGLPLIKTRHGKKNPIQVSAEILTVAKKRAESALGGELDGVVITVPAYFDDAQRAATKEAANLAGLNTLRLLNEPTAAAIAYGLDSGSEGVIAVYDLGGGTFDISILRLSKGVFEVLSTGGDSALGGDDFDHCIAEWILHQLPDQALSADAHRQLHILASKLKIALSEQDDVTFDFMAYQGQISKGVFSELISKLVQKTLMTCKRALRDAKVTTEMVDEIVLVGGSTRVPYVRDQVAQFFKKSPLTSIDPDQVVALGAAIQADILVGNKPEHEVLLLDVIPLSLGIETMGGLVEKIIPRNTTIPVAKAQEFTTFKDGQTGMKVHVVQGEREMVNDCRSLANFSLKGIPPMTAGAAHIRVTYQVDADGLLSVTAMEKSTGVQTAIQVKPSFGLSDTEIADMIRSSFTNAQSDKDARYLAEQRVEADRVIESLLAALQADGDKLLSEEEQQSLIAEIEQLIALRNGNDCSLIEQWIKTLDKASQTFAERPMDFSIRHALTGQSIDEV